MKITIITTAFPYPNRGILGGIERFCENIVLNLKKLGHDVRIVTTFWNGGKRRDSFYEIPILRVHDTRSLFGRVGNILLLSHFSFGLNIIRKKNFFFFKDSDIIIIPVAIGFTRFFKLKKIPIISIFHHYQNAVSLLEYLYVPVFKYLTKKQFKMQKNIVVHSYNARLDLIKYLKIKEEYIKLIVDGVNTKIFNPNNYDHEIKKNYGQNLIFYLGEFYTRKRVPVLLRAMPIVIKEIPDVHLVLIGEGEKHMLERAKQLAVKLGLQEHISFLGFQKDDVVLKFYATADVFVFPSELEGFGLVILESMASGTPVICANKPPMNILIGEGGITFELNNYRDLAQKIIYLLQNREILNKLSERSLKVAQKYDSLNIAKYYVEYIKQIKKRLNN